MKKLLFIYNSKAGKGKIRNNLQDIIEIFTRAGYEVTARPTLKGTDAKELAENKSKDYDLVVLDYNMNNRFDELEQITDKGRCEVLVNSLCAPNCPARATHYRNISENQKIVVRNMKLPKEQMIPLVPWNFKGCNGGKNIYAIRDFCTYVSPEDIWEKYVPMGFKNFKLEGRTESVFNVIELYCHYLVKPEFQGPVRFWMIELMERLKIIQVNMP